MGDDDINWHGELGLSSRGTADVNAILAAHLIVTLSPHNLETVEREIFLTHAHTQKRHKSAPNFFSLLIVVLSKYFFHKPGCQA